MKITQAVIPAAGLGTRFLPLTKSMPKELLPLLGRPALEYSIQEGVASGITDYTLVTNTRKNAIQNYLSRDEDLIARLALHNKHTHLDSLHALLDTCTFSYVMQETPHGLGHAISLAERVIDQDYFGIFLPDDIIISQKPGLAQLIEVANRFNCSVLAVQEVPEHDVNRYGIIDIETTLAPNTYAVSHLVEKPSPTHAPSNLGIIGRYVLSKKIFQSLSSIEPGNNNELQITDALAHMKVHGEQIIAYKIEGTRFDIGTPEGWLEAIITMAAQEPLYASVIQRTMAQYVAPIDQKTL